MNRPEFRTLVEKISVAYAATVEKRRHRQRGGDRQLGARGGVFRQRITDADRILATVLFQRRLCSQDALAELFGVSRGTLRNAYADVLALLADHGFTITRADQRFATASEVLQAVAAADVGDSPR